jgi:hypothetical protein
MNRACVGVALGVALSAGAAQGQVIDPFFAAQYTYTDLGMPPGVPGPLGGLTLLAGTTDTLLIGGSANSGSGALYAVGVSRDVNGHIVAFTGTTTLWGPAPFNDGGVTYGPGGVLFASQWPANMLSQYLPGSTSPDKVIDLAPLGVAQSNASVGFVPGGFDGAGRMKLCSWGNGEFYDAVFAPDGMGTYDILSVTQTATLPGGPEGFAYIPVGSPLFTTRSMIVSEYSAGQLAVYDLDSTGNPVVSTRRDFMTGLTGAEGAFIDPVTGDFLFSTFGGGDRVIVVTGFAVPAPGAAGVLGLGLALAGRRRR